MYCMIVSTLSEYIHTGCGEGLETIVKFRREQLIRDVLSESLGRFEFSLIIYLSALPHFEQK